MKALVTGASGLIGANLVRALLSRGHIVRALVRPTSHLDAIEALPIELAYGDVRQMKEVEAAARGCDVLFHAASNFTYGRDDLAFLERTAVGGSLAVLAAAKRAGVRRVIMTSSSVVFSYTRDRRVLDETAPIHEGTDESPYVLSKVRQHCISIRRAAELGVELIPVCPTLAVGPFGTTLGPSNAAIVAYLSDPFRLTYSGGCNLVSAYDIGMGHVLLAERGVPGTTYLLGAENLEWQDLHSLIAELAGVPGPVAIAGRALCQALAAAEEWRARWQGRSALTTREQAQMVGRYYWYSHEKAASLGYEPRGARVAMAEAIAWLATSSHVSRAVRTDMSLSRSVYVARRTIASREAGLRSRRRRQLRTRVI